MKRIAPILLVALVLLAWGILRRGQQPEYGTSREAYDIYARGNEALESFQYSRAVEQLDQALALDPDFAMARAAYAEVQKRLGNAAASERAAAAADSLAALLADDTERMLVQLRLAYSGLAHRERCDSLLAILEERCPNDLTVLIARAFRADSRGDEKANKVAWERVLEVEPNYANAYNMLGYAAAWRGDYKEAIANMKKYAYLAPDLANPHDSLGEVLTWIGQYEEAEQEFRLALQAQPDFYYSLLNLARVYIQRGQLRTGFQILEKTRAQVAGTEIEKRIDRMVIELYYEFDLMKETGLAIERYVARFPQDDVSPIYRSMHLAYTGALAAAHTVCDSMMTELRAKKSDSDDPHLQQYLDGTEHRFKAEFAEIEGRYEQAAADWEAVLVSRENQPPHAKFSARVRYGECLLKLGRPAEALDQAQLVLKTNPRVIRACLLQVEALAALGQDQLAWEGHDWLDTMLAAADADLPAVAHAAALKSRLAARADS